MQTSGTVGSEGDQWGGDRQKARWEGEVWACLCFVMQIMEVGGGETAGIVRTAFRMCFQGTLGDDWAVGPEVTWKLLEQPGREMGAAEEAPFLAPYGVPDILQCAFQMK